MSDLYEQLGKKLLLTDDYEAKIRELILKVILNFKYNKKEADYIYIYVYMYTLVLN